MKRPSARLVAASLLMMLLAPAALAKTTVGVAMALFDDNFLTTLRQAMASYAQTRPDVDLQFQDAQGDVGRQLSQVQNFVAQKVSAIIVVPVDTASTREMTAMASGAGIPLVYVNRKPDEKTMPEKVAVVASDDLLAGRLEATEVAKRLNGKGNVVILLGDLANNSTQGRTSGSKEVLAKYPGIKLIEEQTANWERTKAIDLVSNWLSKGDRIDGIISNNDEMAIGAVIALRQAGLDPRKIPIGGVDATADGLAELAKGDMAVTVFQNAKGQAEHGVEEALKMAAGQPYQANDVIPYELVTKENMVQYSKN